MNHHKGYFMRDHWIIGNWKMQVGNKKTEEFIQNFLERFSTPTWQIGIAPPFTSISTAISASQGSFLKIGAQNVSAFSEGAYTGEIAATFLEEMGVDFVILGHSERRFYFQETDAIIFQKIQQALNRNLHVVLCIGETKEEKDRGHAENILTNQLFSALATLSSEQLENIIIAYEPVWAIGTGETATPEQVQHIHQILRNSIKTQWNDQIADKIPILYGGSVKPDNIESLMKEPDIDGALVGGASLKVEGLIELIKKGQQAKQ